MITRTEAIKFLQDLDDDDWRSTLEQHTKLNEIADLLADCGHCKFNAPHKGSETSPCKRCVDSYSSEWFQEQDKEQQ